MSAYSYSSTQALKREAMRKARNAAFYAEHATSDRTRDAMRDCLREYIREARALNRLLIVHRRRMHGREKVQA